MKPLENYTQCDLCAAPEFFSATTLQAVVASSERVFEQETFTVWQCGNCQCIHALEGVDLGYYYSQYGLHESNEPDRVTRFFFGKKLAWLKKAGITQQHSILDYGCGGGHFLRFLQQQGYQAYGYDPFTDEFADTGMLSKRYDVVMSSDVIEHDTSVMGHLDTLIGLCAENGFIYIETPDALAIDLAQISAHRQILQQPFHRHLLTHTWLIDTLAEKGWQATQIARQPFFHSWIPFLNVPAMDYYWDTYGGLATLNEGYRWSALLSPKYWYLGLFGAFIYGKDEVQLILRPKQPA